MHFSEKYYPQQGITAQTSHYQAPNGIDEYHIILHVEPRDQPFPQQLQRLYTIEDQIPTEPQYQGAHYVLKRYFLSDSTNQQPHLRHQPHIAQSYIQQQPLDGSKIAVWMYLQRGTTITTRHDTIISSHNGYHHLWKMNIHHPHGDSYQQTHHILQDYAATLSHFDATLERNCLRTWFFVRDVDTQYHGLVQARKEHFATQGLTHDTHYLASTGIQGLPSDTNAIIQMGTYAITGPSYRQEQQHYLYAPTHLNPTHQYGVTFERGVCIEYGDRAHALISGTASIDNQGQVLHVGDIRQQTQRMWENVEALLAEAHMTFDDVMHNIVYLRDTADYPLVRQMFKARYPHIPTIIALAPVCRPTWLIEMECIAVRQRTNKDHAEF